MSINLVRAIEELKEKLDLDISIPELKDYIKEEIDPLQYDALCDTIKKCSLCKLSKNGACVPPSVSASAEIMIVGEAPAFTEIEKGVPFVGASGQLLDKMLASAEEKINPRWNRENIYISNIVKGHPLDNEGKTRAPALDEIVLCKQYINIEISILKPKIIICAGASAANVLIHPNFKITEQHGKIYDDGQPMAAIYHPSFILHKQGTQEERTLKMDVWNDLIAINKFLDSIMG